MIKINIGGQIGVSGRITTREGRRGIGTSFPTNSGFSFNGLITGGNQTTFANLLDGDLENTFIGDTNTDNNSITIVFYNILPLARFTLLRVFASSTTPGSFRSGRFNEVVVEGSNNTTTGADGDWTNIGWVDSVTIKPTLVSPLDVFNDHFFNPTGPFSAYRFRMTNVEQFIAVQQVELVVVV